METYFNEVTMISVHRISDSALPHYSSWSPGYTDYGGCDRVHPWRGSGVTRSPWWVLPNRSCPAARQFDALTASTHAQLNFKH